MREFKPFREIEHVKIPEGVISIDSLKFRIPLDFVKVYDKNITSARIVINEETGEEIERLKAKGILVEEYGCKTYYGVMNLKGVEYLYMLFNSKLLGKRYFEGITAETIHLAYQAIIDQGKVDFKVQHFLKGRCTDIDFKMDSINPFFKETVKVMHSCSKSFTQIGKGCEIKDGNLICGNRKKATPSHPYIKFYDKSWELRNKSDTFHVRYFVDGDNDGDIDLIPDNIARVETTVKNNDHLNRLGIDSNTLEHLLELSYEQMKNIFIRAYKYHFNKRPKPMKFEKLTPSESIAINSIQMGLKLGWSYDISVDYILEGIESRETRRRQRAKFDSLFENYIKGTTPEIIAREHEKFLNQIGWNFLT